MSLHKHAASSYILHPMFSNVIPFKGSHEAFLNPLCVVYHLNSFFLVASGITQSKIPQWELWTKSHNNKYFLCVLLDYCTYFLCLNVYCLACVCWSQHDISHHACSPASNECCGQSQTESPPLSCCQPHAAGRG